MKHLSDNNIKDCDGCKLWFIHDPVILPSGEEITPTDTLVRDYSGGHIYENGVLERTLMPVGYYSSADSQYCYYVKDYQGNNIAVVTDINGSAKAVSATLMYPFGSELTEFNATDRYRFGGKELDTRGGLFHYDFGARHYDPMLPMFNGYDRRAEKYCHLSPFAYCAGNPIRHIDPSGEMIFMLFYSTGNNSGDEMFEAAAKTRESNIINSKDYDPNKDLTLCLSFRDVSEIADIVQFIVDNYSEKYGKTAEFGIWSHSAKDGPIGSEYTSEFRADRKQMTLEGWGKINFNWSDNASAYFYGCNSGAKYPDAPSFVTKISALNNFRNVDVYGQTKSAYPSLYPNTRMPSPLMYINEYSYPTYLVGGDAKEGLKVIINNGAVAYPMRKSRNGKSVGTNFYQKGRRVK